MYFDLHVATAIVSTALAGWLMVTAGVRKGALEHRRRRRICPSCGREIQARVCITCSS